MTQKQVKIWYTTGVILVLVLILSANAFFTKTYPAAIVGTSVITKKYWDQGLTIGKKLDSQVPEQEIKSRMIRTKSEQQLAMGWNIVPDLQAEFLYETSGKNKEFQALLKNYFNSDPNLFKEFVAKPQAFEAAWRIGYNSRFELNKTAYDRAESILSRVKNGETFEEVAKSESDDKVTGQLGGDLGFVAEGELLPELEKAVMKAGIGQVNQKITVSRLGYHIIYPVETAEKDDVKVWHVKHILIKTTGFDSWINSVLSRLWVWQIK